MPRADLYSQWRNWCEHLGKKETDETRFGRDLRAAVPSLGSSNRRDFGARVRNYTGIRLAAIDEVDHLEHVPPESTCGAKEISNSVTCDTHHDVNRGCTRVEHDPPVPADSPVDDLPVASPPSHAQHKATGCQSRRWWVLVTGGVYCLECWPPTDHRYVKQKGIAP